VNKSPEVISPQQAQLIVDRYHEICDVLQLTQAERPRVEPFAPPRAGDWQVYGDFNRRQNRIRLSATAIENDYLIAHELVHAVCAKRLKYFGSHGLPYLVLHDLMIEFYFPDSDLLNAATVVETQWATIAPARFVDQTLVEARSIVEQLVAVLKDEGFSLDNRPSLMQLAGKVQTSAARRFCFDWLSNRRAIVTRLDYAWTQTHGIFPLILVLVGYTLVGTFLLACGLASLAQRFDLPMLRTGAVALFANGFVLLCFLSIYVPAVRFFVGLDLSKSR
jgi:hypothetical protein